MNSRLVDSGVGVRIYHLPYTTANKPAPNKQKANKEEEYTIKSHITLWPCKRTFTKKEPHLQPAQPQYTISITTTTNLQSKTLPPLLLQPQGHHRLQEQRSHRPKARIVLLWKWCRRQGADHLRDSTFLSNCTLENGLSGWWGGLRKGSHKVRQVKRSID